MRKLSLRCGCLVLLTALAAFGQANSAADTAKRADIQKLMALTGSEKLMDQMMAQMTQSMAAMRPKNSTPGQNEEFADYSQEFQKQFSARRQAFLDISAEGFNRHFTHEDIKQLIAFYNTPLGQKMLAVMPQMMMETTQAAMQLGQEIAQGVATEMQKRQPRSTPK